MSIFRLSANREPDARRARFDVVTAAMLNGGASGGWLMGRALRSCGFRRLSGGDQRNGGEDGATPIQCTRS